MHQEFIASILFRIKENPERIKICLDLLSEEQVWENLSKSGNSIGNLILHLCGNIDQYVYSSLGGNPDTRERDMEFASHHRYSKTELLLRFNDCINRASDIIENTSNSELERLRQVQGFEFSGIGILVHVCEHLSYHVGQISVLTKIFTAKDLGYYKNQNLNAKNIQ